MKIFFISLCIVFVCLLTPSCLWAAESGFEVRRWKKISWNKAFVYQSQDYRIETNTSFGTAKAVGNLMQDFLQAFEELSGVRKKGSVEFLVKIYASKREYDRLARQMGFPARMTSGLYIPVPPSAIHLPYVYVQDQHPAKTLLHEGVHQFIHKLMSFEVPGEFRDIVTEDGLLGIPLWLNEGLAAYMESSLSDNGEFQAGRLNKERLNHLQKIIKQGECPSVRELISRPYGQGLSADDYAVVWGLVYVILQERDGRERMQEYLRAGQQGFFTDAALEFAAEFLPNGRLTDDFQGEWNLRLGRKSAEFFQDIFVDGNWKDWESRWKESVMRLKASD